MYGGVRELHIHTNTTINLRVMTSDPARIRYEGRDLRLSQTISCELTIWLNNT